MPRARLQPKRPIAADRQWLRPTPAQLSRRPSHPSEMGGILSPAARRHKGAGVRLLAALQRRRLQANCGAPVSDGAAPEGRRGAVAKRSANCDPSESGRCGGVVSGK